MNALVAVVGSSDPVRNITIAAIAFLCLQFNIGLPSEKKQPIIQSNVYKHTAASRVMSYFYPIGYEIVNWVTG